MRIAVGTIVCLAVMLPVSIFAPFWWWIQVVPLIFGFLAARSHRQAFGTGSLSAGLLWLAASLYYGAGDGQVIVDRVAGMFHLESPWLVPLLTCVIAFLAGGLACSAGFGIRELLSPRKRSTE